MRPMAACTLSLGGRQAFVALVDPFAKAEAGAGEGDAAIRAPTNRDASSRLPSRTARASKPASASRWSKR